MVVRNGEMDVGIAVGAGIESSLYEMLLHRSARSVLILMEEEEALGQLTVIEALSLEEVSHDSLIFASLGKVAYATAVVLLALGTESLLKGEFLYIVEESLLKVCGGYVVGSAEESEEILEHSAGGTACRHELYDAVVRREIVGPVCHVLLYFLLCGLEDAIADGGGSLNLKERETLLEVLELVLHHFLRDASCGNLV